tara:strand:- start:64 stop:177 length:114 start_codon:yes stop_codon:yes gene_type:complete
MKTHIVKIKRQKVIKLVIKFEKKNKETIENKIDLVKT